MNRLVKGIGSGIGLASEAIAQSKEKKRLEKERATSSNPRARSASPNPQARSIAPYPDDKKMHGEEEEDDDDEDSDGDDIEQDEEAWALDDAAGELTSPPAYEELNKLPPELVNEVVESFMRSHLSPGDAKPVHQLPCPVILPQRRPKDKSRGFIRAYAPVLGECTGIDQKTFLDFLEDFDKASQVEHTRSLQTAILRITSCLGFFSFHSHQHGCHGRRLRSRTNHHGNLHRSPSRCAHWPRTSSSPPYQHLP